MHKIIWANCKPYMSNQALLVMEDTTIKREDREIFIDIVRAGNAILKGLLLIHVSETTWVPAYISSVSGDI